MYDVISIGSATLDVFLRSMGLEVDRDDGIKEICVPYGAKVEVDEIHFETGGGGTNSAVTFARQGFKTACVVKIGDSFAGQKVKQDLQSEGVDTSLMVEEKDGYTDYSTILWAADGGRTILVSRGKTRLEVKDINWEKLKAKWFYISSVEGNLDLVSHITSRAAGKAFGDARHISPVKIAWNPGGKELAQRETVMSLLPKIELLNLNKEEMDQLLGFKKGEVVEKVLAKAQKLPCHYVVVTDSLGGSYTWNGEFWLHAGVFKNAPRRETTGAGDSFGSGLVSGLMRNLPLEDCLYLATGNAGSVVGQVGGKKGILKKGEVTEWMKGKLPIQKLT